MSELAQPEDMGIVQLENRLRTQQQFEMQEQIQKLAAQARTRILDAKEQIELIHHAFAVFKVDLKAEPVEILSDAVYDAVPYVSSRAPPSNTEGMIAQAISDLEETSLELNRFVMRSAYELTSFLEDATYPGARDEHMDFWTFHDGEDDYAKLHKLMFGYQILLHEIAILPISGDRAIREAHDRMQRVVELHCDQCLKRPGQMIRAYQISEFTTPVFQRHELWDELNNYNDLVKGCSMELISAVNFCRNYLLVIGHGIPGEPGLVTEDMTLQDLRRVYDVPYGPFQAAATACQKHLQEMKLIQRERRLASLV